MDRWRRGEEAGAAAAGRIACADSEADSEADSAGVSLGRRPVATTATAGLAAQRGKKPCILFEAFFFPYLEKKCVWRNKLKIMLKHPLKSSILLPN